MQLLRTVEAMEQLADRCGYVAWNRRSAPRACHRHTRMISLSRVVAVATSTAGTRIILPRRSRSNPAADLLSSAGERIAGLKCGKAPTDLSLCRCACTKRLPLIAQYDIRRCCD